MLYVTANFRYILFDSNISIRMRHESKSGVIKWIPGLSGIGRQQSAQPRGQLRAAVYEVKYEPSSKTDQVILRLLLFIIFY